MSGLRTPGAVPAVHRRGRVSRLRDRASDAPTPRLVGRIMTDLDVDELIEAGREAPVCDRCETTGVSLYLTPMSAWESVCKPCYVELKGEQSDLRRWST